MSGKVISGDSEVMRRAIESRLGDVYTALPGTVKKYYPETQTADIEPVIRRALPTIDDDITHEDLPILPNLPVLFPRGGGYSVTWPLSLGDGVQVIVQTYAFSQWRQSGKVSDPGDLRLHSLGNCICIPGLAPNALAVDPAQAGANAFVIEGPEIRLGRDATEHVALAASLFTFIHDMISSGTPIANDGGAALQTAWKLYITNHTSPNPFAATKAKAK